MSLYLSIYLQAWKRSYSARLPQFWNLTTSKNAAIQRDFFNLCTWQHQKRSNSARHPSKMESWVQSWRLRTNAFCDFSSPSVYSKLLRLPRKSDARSYEVLHRSRKIISANLKIGGSKIQPLSGNQRPDLLTALMSMSLVLCMPWKMSHSCHRFLTFYKTLTFCSLLTGSIIPCACHAKRHLNVQKWSEHVVLFTFWLRHVLRATTACTFSTSELPKVARTCGVFKCF